MRADRWAGRAALGFGERRCCRRPGPPARCLRPHGRARQGVFAARAGARRCHALSAATGPSERGVGSTGPLHGAAPSQSTPCFVCIARNTHACPTWYCTFPNASLAISRGLWPHASTGAGYGHAGGGDQSWRERAVAGAARLRLRLRLTEHPARRQEAARQVRTAALFLWKEDWAVIAGRVGEGGEMAR